MSANVLCPSSQPGWRSIIAYRRRAWILHWEVNPRNGAGEYKNQERKKERTDSDDHDDGWTMLMLIAIMDMMMPMVVETLCLSFESLIKILLMPLSNVAAHYNGP